MPTRIESDIRDVIVTYLPVVSGDEVKVYFSIDNNPEEFIIPIFECQYQSIKFLKDLAEVVRMQEKMNPDEPMYIQIIVGSDHNIGVIASINKPTKVEPK